MKEIELTRGQVALVDDEDYDELSRYKWCALKAPKTFYATRVRHLEEYPGPKTIYMHHVIAGCKGIDHKDNNGLNNQKHNLRPATKSQNAINVKMYRNNTSGYKGVRLDKRRNKWQAVIRKDQIRTHIGYFGSPEEAHAAYCKAAKELFGEFANTGEQA